MLSASTAPQRTFVRLSGRFPRLRVFLNVCQRVKNQFSKYFRKSSIFYLLAVTDRCLKI